MSNKRPNKETTVRIPETLRKVKNIIGVFSAKGGVGKSEISLNLALSLATEGYRVGLLDADIHGQSQPVLFEAYKEVIDVKDKLLLSPLKKRGVKFISMGLANDYNIKRQPPNCSSAWHRSRTFHRR